MGCLAKGWGCKVLLTATSEELLMMPRCCVLRAPAEALALAGRAAACRVRAAVGGHRRWHAPPGRTRSPEASSEPDDATRRRRRLAGARGAGRFA